MFWEAIQEAGKYNERTDSTEPWDFTWGAQNMTDLRKALTTIMKADRIDAWLAQPSEMFPDTPQTIINEGNWEAVWLAVYEIGEGVLS